jgi:hypothetical protein
VTEKGQAPSCQPAGSRSRRDDYLPPADARTRFARVPQAEVSTVEKAKHLWVGEKYVRIVLNEIVRRVNPGAWPLPTEWKDRA